ncbi:glycine-rich protein DOT1-like [Homarus americanus]|uniref:glycine-rich protein DOT1-like n=1 Tax=Homarus americanus TaxID=6706 RepID=UPI001C45C820|nr:glycine-rich protein DOT1-like [Homarus americanus]
MHVVYITVLLLVVVTERGEAVGIPELFRDDYGERPSSFNGRRGRGGGGTHDGGALFFDRRDDHIFLGGGGGGGYAAPGPLSYAGGHGGGSVFSPVSFYGRGPVRNSLGNRHGGILGPIGDGHGGGVVGGNRGPIGERYGGGNRNPFSGGYGGRGSRHGRGGRGGVVHHRYGSGGATSVNHFNLGGPLAGHTSSGSRLAHGSPSVTYGSTPLSDLSAGVYGSGTISLLAHSPDSRGLYDAHSPWVYGSRSSLGPLDSGRFGSGNLYGPFHPVGPPGYGK